MARIEDETTSEEPPEPGEEVGRVWRCCGEAFESKRAYDRHVEREHDGRPPGDKAYV